MALSWVQDGTSIGGSGSPLTAVIALTVTAGNTLVVHISQTGSSGARTYSVSDSGGGTWVEAVRAEALVIDTTRETAVWYCANHPGGSINISVTHGQGSITFVAGASEYSGFGGSVTVAASDTFADTSTTTNHKMSSAGISAAGEVLAVGSGVLRGTGTECNPGSGYTEVHSGYAAIDVLFQRQIFASGCTNETGPWTNTVTNRASLNCFCLLAGAAAASGQPMAKRHQGIPFLGGSLRSRNF